MDEHPDVPLTELEAERASRTLRWSQEIGQLVKVYSTG